MSISPFCVRCDSVLPLHISNNAVICKLCKYAHSYTNLLNKEIKTTIVFNTRDASLDTEEDTEKQIGPMTDRKCPGCGNEGMSYTTRQLRGADEGQTVFYLCPECKFQDNENS